MSNGNYITMVNRKWNTGGFITRPSNDPNPTHRADPEFPGVHSGPSRSSAYRGWASRRGRGGTPRSSKKSNEERGRFENGIWMCDCNPRLPAERFQVKKESVNKGRWFYTCQRSANSRTKGKDGGRGSGQDHLHIPVVHEGESCRFFLWEEEAKPRMEAAVLAGHRSEPRALLSQAERRWRAEDEREAAALVSEPQTPSKRKREEDEEGDRTITPISVRTVVQAATPPRSPTASFASAMSETLKMPSKRKLPWLSDGESQVSASHTLGAADSSFSTSAGANKGTNGAAKLDIVAGGDEETASEAESDTFSWPLTGEEASELERVAEEAETPRKARKLDAFDTPTHDRTAGAVNNAGLMTPGTTPAKPAPNVSAVTPSTNSMNELTPTPSRFRDALATPGTLSTGSMGSLTASFHTLLRAHHVTLLHSAASEVNALLRRHEAQLAGAVKGRDIARQAVKSREETVAKLTSRVEGLEGENAGLKALVSALGLEKGKSSRKA